MRDFFVAKFQGDAAEDHKLPAYEATQSLYGITRSALISLNYLAEGRVRRRNFRAIGFEINIIANREGSFETLFEIITDPTAMAVLSSIGLGVGGNLATDFVKSMWHRAVGQQPEPDIEELEANGKLNAGDLAAIVDAIEPAMREAHRSIGNGAHNILIVTGDHNVVNFDAKSKEYVNSSIFEESLQVRLFSIGSFNANSGYGRAFDIEQGRTIAFQLDGHVDRVTIDTLLSSFSSYARKKRLGDDLASAIALKYHAIVSIDDRIKKLIVVSARPTLSDFL